MIKNEPCPDLRTIRPPEGKAALVIAKKQSVAKENHNTFNWLDRTFIGSTKNKCFFYSFTDPGEHYLSTMNDKNAKVLMPGMGVGIVLGTVLYTAIDSPVDVVKLNLEKDKTYYINQTVSFKGFLHPRSNIDFMTADELYEEMDGNCNYFVINAEDPGSDLTDEELKQRIEVYQARLAEEKEENSDD